MIIYYSAERRDFTAMLSVTLDLEPHGKGRPRVTRTGRAYTPEATRSWEARAADLLRAAHNGAPPMTGPLEVVVQFVHRRPASYPKRGERAGALWRPSKPDLDNLVKALLDAGSTAGVWEDDRQVVRLQAEALTAPVGMAPCIRLRVGELRSIDE